MPKYDVGLITNDGEVRRWRDVGQEVTIYSTFSSRELGIESQKFAGRIFIDRNHVYLCWDKYTARFTTMMNEPVKIKRHNNVYFLSDFFLIDEKYKGRLKHFYQIIIDDEAGNVYFFKKEEQKNNKVIYTNRKSGISFISNGQITRDDVVGTGKNYSTYACIIKKGVPSFATSNGQPTFDTVTFNNVKAFKQGPFVFFFNSLKDKASVVDTRNGQIVRFSHAIELSHVSLKKNCGKSSVKLGDTYSFEFNPDGSAYKVMINQTKTHYSKENRENILGDKTYWEDFEPGSSIFLP